MLFQAVADSLRATSVDPTYSRGIARAAKALLCMGKLDESIEKYEAALAVDPTNRSLRSAPPPPQKKITHMHINRHTHTHVNI